MISHHRMAIRTMVISKLNNSKQGTSRAKPKLKELKSQVYRLACVGSTKALKSLRSEFISLDFRRISSWQLALVLLKDGSTEQTFEEWRSNPPEEYKELFSEINKVSRSYKKSIERGLNLSKTLRKSAEGMEEIAQDLSSEVDTLNQEASMAEVQAQISQFNQ